MNDSEETVLNWCRQQTAGYANVNIVDFTMSWKDGLALSALIDSSVPGLIDIESMSRENVYENISEALDMAEQLFSLKTALDVQTVIETNHDQVFKFVREIYNASQTGNTNEQGVDREEQEDNDDQGLDRGFNLEMFQLQFLAEFFDMEDDDANLRGMLREEGEIAGGNVLPQPDDAQITEPEILRWCRQMTENEPAVDITDFSETWTDGSALIALMHAIRPDIIPAVENRDFDLESLEFALEIVTQLYDVPRNRMCRVNDILDGNEMKIFPMVRWVYCQLSAEPLDLIEDVPNNEDIEDNEEEVVLPEPQPDLPDAVKQVVEQEREAPPEPFLCLVCFENKMSDRAVSCSPIENSANTEVHRLCLECIQPQAKALSVEGFLAPHGLGFPCVEPVCKNIFRWQQVAPLIESEQVRNLLNDRLNHEALICIYKTVERCTHCAFTVEIEDSMEEQQYFDCMECAAKFCRRCKIDYMNHIHMTCDEASRSNNEHRVQNGLAQAIIRICHKCGLQFAKSDGCNKMSCRCGATQCYTCRDVDIEYSHFCSHARPNNQCVEQCGRRCVLNDDANNAEADSFNQTLQTLQADSQIGFIARNYEQL